MVKELFDTFCCRRSSREKIHDGEAERAWNESRSWKIWTYHLVPVVLILNNHLSIFNRMTTSKKFFALLNRNPNEYFPFFYKRGRNMVRNVVSLQHNRNPIGPLKAQDGFVSQKCPGDRFLGCTQFNPYRLSPKGKNNQ